MAWWNDAWGWAGKHSDSIGIGLLGVGLGVCTIATAGICFGTVATTAIVGGGVTVAGARYNGDSWGKSLVRGGVDAGMWLAGAPEAKAVRWFGKGRNYKSFIMALTKAAGRKRARDLVLSAGKDYVRSKAFDFGWDKLLKGWK